MEFSPNNPVVKRCIQGMSMEDKGKLEEAEKLFLQASNEATNEFEKFLAAHYVARVQKHIPDKLRWFETALKSALLVNDDAVRAAFPSLYLNIAQCYEELNDFVNAKKNRELANSCVTTISDAGPFYHGTKADLKIGDLLTAGSESNYQAELIMNHIYFTAIINGAGLAAELAKGNRSPRVYIVEPMGSFENDPNVTNKKFPGNPTRSYRSQHPLKIIGEVTNWARQTKAEIQKWNERLANSKGEIIN
jgi:rifampin ADP-ribosylating transferase